MTLARELQDEPAEHRSIIVIRATDRWVSQVRLSDFETFDYIFAMDRSNLADLQRLQRTRPRAKAKVMLFGEYSGTGRAEAIGDPYYGAINGFEVAYEQLTRFSKNFLAEVFPDVKGMDG